MKYCKYCGRQFDEDSAFCPQCGKEISELSPLAAPAQDDCYENREQLSDMPSKHEKFNRLHCPRCKHYELSPIVETVETVGGATRLFGSTYATRTNIVNRSYWICAHCGLKFRNIDELESRNERRTKKNKRTIFIIFGLIIFSLKYVGIKEDTLVNRIGEAIVFAGIGAICYFLVVFFAKRRDEKAAQLRHDCYD